MKKGSKLLNFAIDLLFPPRCAVCSDVVAIGKDLCDECAKALTQGLCKKELCKICGKPKESCVCGIIKPYFSRCISSFVYDSSTVELLLRLKNIPQSHAAAQLADIMQQSFKASLLKNEKFDWITEVPMSEKKLMKRGFSHSKALALLLSEKLEIAYHEPTVLQSERYVSQHSLDRHMRAENAKRGYQRIEKAYIEGRVLLVDDIITTGATLDRCAQLLLQSGASEVCCITAATTFLKVDRTGERIDDNKKN